MNKSLQQSAVGVLVFRNSTRHMRRPGLSYFVWQDRGDMHDGKLQPVPRPTGVWISTIWAGLFAGVAPMALAAFGLWHGAIPVGQGVGVISLCASVVSAAVSAWRGSRSARNALVILVTLYYLGVAANNIMLATSEELPRQLIIKSWGRAIRSVITAAVISLYLCRSRAARKFFGQEPQPVAVVVSGSDGGLNQFP